MASLIKMKVLNSSRRLWHSSFIRVRCRILLKQNAPKCKRQSTVLTQKTIASTWMNLCAALWLFVLSTWQTGPMKTLSQFRQLKALSLYQRWLTTLLCQPDSTSTQLEIKLRCRDWSFCRRRNRSNREELSWNSTEITLIRKRKSLTSRVPSQWLPQLARLFLLKWKWNVDSRRRRIDRTTSKTPRNRVD